MSTVSLTFDIFGNDKTASKALRGVGEEAEKSGSRVSGAFKAIGVAAAGLGVAGAFAVLKTGFDEAKDASAGAAQLAAGIKSTGNAANVTVAGMEKLATSIQGYSGQTDDSIVQTEALLLTFTNIKNQGPDKIFDQATVAAADMAARMGGSASESAIKLGKALNDPVGGITSLTKVGVQFTDQQKKQIKALVESGDTLGAQKIILGELNKEFGGSAKAAGETLPGQINRAKRSFEDMSQALVEALLPALTSVMNFILNTVIPTVKTMGEWIKKNSDWLVPLVAVLGTAFVAFRVVTGAIALFNLVMAMNPIGLVIIAIAALVVGIIYAYTHFEIFRDVLGTVWEALKTAYNWVAQNWPLLLAILTGPIGLAVLAIKTHFNDIKGYATEVYNWVSGKFNDIVNYIAGMPGRIATAASGMFNGIIGAFRSAINFVISGWNNLSFSIPGVDTHIPGVGSIGGFTINTPNIPLLAAGGVVTSPTLAMIGDAGPEAVVPLSRAGLLGGNVTVTVVAPQYWGGSTPELGRHLVGALEDWARGGGTVRIANAVR